MPAVVDQALQHQVAIAKRALRLTPRADDGLSHLTGLVHQAHTAPATARYGFDQQGKTELAGFTDQVLIILILTQVSRCARHTCSNHAFLRQRFVAHGVNGGGWWADEDQPCICTRLCETCVLAQKPITWMDRISTCFLGCFKQFFD